MPRIGQMNRRILVYGTTGSGKSRLATRISELTAIPYHDADAITWQPNWQQVSAEVQREEFSRICAQEKWVLDSAYDGWRDVVFDRADLVVALDYSRALSLTRLIRRTTRRLITRELACNGNVESLRQVFSSDSILLWHFRSFSRKRRRIREWSVSPTGPAMIRFSTPAAAQEWAESLAPAPQVS